jgi:hypothetical protein
MTKREAAELLNFYGAESDAADRARMDWMPSAASRQAIREACATEPTRLTKAGRRLYESDVYNPAVYADHLAGRA